MNSLPSEGRVGDAAPDLQALSEELENLKLEPDLNGPKSRPALLKKNETNLESPIDTSHDLPEEHAGSASAPPQRWIKLLSRTKTESARQGVCELCLRPSDALTMHHLYPKSTRRPGRYTYEQQHSTAALCWPCHCVIHNLFSAESLAIHFHSVKALKSHKDVKGWLVWAKSRPVSEVESYMIPIGAKGRDLKPMIKDALDHIWTTQDFPVEDDGRTFRQRATFLRDHVRRLTNNTRVQKPELRTVMQSEPKYKDWFHQVFVEGEEDRKKRKLQHRAELAAAKAAV